MDTEVFQTKPLFLHDGILLPILSPMAEASQVYAHVYISAYNP